MTFIYISISLKTSSILENKSQVFENDCSGLVSCDLNEAQRYHIKSKNLK